MATKKKMLLSSAGTAAAGGGGGAALDIDDVFSTYLYDGTGATQSINNGIALGNFGRGTSTLFSGTGGSSDFLKRTSDLTGNSDGKTLTLSAWIFPEEDTNLNFFACANSGGSDRMLLSLDDTQKLALNLNDSSGTTLLTLESRATQGAGLPLKAWSHVLISVDLSDTSKRHLYINDAIPSHVDWDAYNNGTVDFTQPKWGVGGSPTSGRGTERMAHLYFDYTYRDLSVASNRRHFIDANGGSTSTSTQSALNPIIYLPLTEDYTTGKNLGTGGDFTVNGSPTVLDTGTEYEDGYSEGGAILTKRRDSSSGSGPWFNDTERGITKYISTSNTGTGGDSTSSISTVTSYGYTLGGGFSGWNNSAGNYASWTFRKAPKFFTCLTYSGTGPGSSANEQQVSHDLGAKPGIVMIKRTDATGDWWVFTDVIDGSNDYGHLNQASAFGNSANNVATDSVFNVGGVLNTSGATYVSYLFANNDGDGTFGPDGDQDIIKCGSFTVDGSGNASVDLGWEPQWLLMKKANSSHIWYIVDNMRGLGASGQSTTTLYPSASNAEYGPNGTVFITPTGFYNETPGNYSTSGNEIIYMAIRRGPLAVPTDATKVFAMDTLGATTPNPPSYNAGFPVDLGIMKSKTSGTDFWRVGARLTGEKRLRTDSNDAEATDTQHKFDYQDGWYDAGSYVDSQYQSWMWRRAPGYFDALAFKGNGVDGRTVEHTLLGVVPEMMWIKNRDVLTENWIVYAEALGNTRHLRLNENEASITNVPVWNNTSPTSTEFTISDNNEVNRDETNYIAYLFASAPGVSKVGSLTYSGSTLNVDCGFSNGARFVLIKRTDSTGNWLVFDVERGIVAGADPVLSLNTTDAEGSYDWIDPYSSGFTLAAGAWNNGDYIFYAIA